MSKPPVPDGRSRLALLLPGLGLIAGFLAGRRRPAALLLIAANPPLPRASVTRPTPRSITELRLGAPGAGGLVAAWPAGSEDGRLAPHIEYQYSGMAHQAEASLAGMWIFLATELLFFGALFLLYLVYRVLHPTGFAVASQHSELWIGTTNTVLLLTSSAVFAWGFGRAKRGDNRALFWSCIATMLLGVVFLGLKGYEWKLDLDKNLFPGPDFGIAGPDRGGAELFWSFYFVATGLHGIHMIVGVGVVGWIARAAHRARFSPGYYTPVEAVGLYWSFVDMVWLSLYPAIYLVHRGGA